MHEVLVNRLGGLSLPRKSVVRLTDRPDMTLDVYRGRKSTTQQHNLLNLRVVGWCDIFILFYPITLGGRRGTTDEFATPSGGAMVLDKLPVPGRPTIFITVGQGPIVLAVGAGGGDLDVFTLIYPFSSFSLSLGDGSI